MPEKIPTAIAAAAASAQARRPEGVADAGYLDQLAERLAAAIRLPVTTARARVAQLAVSAAARPGRGMLRSTPLGG
jgi:hypothetical protein